MAAVYLSVSFESWRVKRVYGKVQNINKKVTYIVALLFLVPNLMAGWLACLNYLFTRSAFYDPWLNIKIGKDKFYRSEKTNSILDRIYSYFDISPELEMKISIGLMFATWVYYFAYQIK